MPYKDPERQRAYAREWIKRNAQKARDAVRRWRIAHPDEHNAKNRLYYARNRDARLAHTTAYHREHPEVGRAKSQNYRARKLAAAGSFTAAEWLAPVERYGGPRGPFRQSERLQAGHPL